MVFGEKKIECHHCGKKIKRKDYRKHLVEKHPSEVKISDYITKKNIKTTKSSNKPKAGAFRKKSKPRYPKRTRR